MKKHTNGCVPYAKQLSIKDIESYWREAEACKINTRSEGNISGIIREGNVNTRSERREAATLNKQSISNAMRKEKINELWLGSMGGKKEVPYGCRIEIRGRIRGAAKKTKLEVTKGSIKLQSAGRSIEYSKKSLLTKWGVLGLKVVKAGR